MLIFTSLNSTMPHIIEHISAIIQADKYFLSHLYPFKEKFLIYNYMRDFSLI